MTNIILKNMLQFELPFELILEISGYCEISKLKYLNIESYKAIINEERKWRKKYEKYFHDNNIKLPLLSLAVNYNWKKEYDRIIDYKYWNLFSEINFNTDRVILDGNFDVFPKEFYELTNLRSLCVILY